MKNFLRKNGLGLLAIIISVGTWLSFWLRFSPFTWDSFGAITAIMGIMITFLVGVQISSIIRIRDFKKKMENEQKDFKNKIKEEQKKLDEKVRNLDLRQKDSDYTYSYYFARIYGQSLNLPEYTRYSLQAMFYALQCGTKQRITDCNELIKGVNEIIKMMGGLSINESMQESLLKDFYRVKVVSKVEGVDNKTLEEIGKGIITASIIPE